MLRTSPAKHANAPHRISARHSQPISRAPAGSPADHHKARQRTLTQHLGTPHLLDAGPQVSGSTKAQVYSASSRLSSQDKADCLRWAGQMLRQNKAHMNELAQKRHTQLQLPDLLHTPAGEQLAALFAGQALQPFTAAGMHVAAFEVVVSKNNTKPKPSYKGHHIVNKLGCQHQDLRGNEPWMDDRAPLGDLPGSLRLVFDISPVGQRWFEFRLLCKGSQGELWLDEEPVHSDLVAFDRLAAGSGGFHNPGGSWIFHARRSSNPGELGVSVVADVVVTAGLDGTGACSSEVYCQTPAFEFFHGGAMQ